MTMAGLKIILLIIMPVANCLTEDELSKFLVRNVTETNTNLMGSVTVEDAGDYHRITSNGIPDHETGTFPGVGNPNNLKAQTYSERVAKNPSFADKVTCMPNGPIAFARNGVPLFNPFNVNGENAVEGPTAEVFDSCNGHPAEMGAYHYHQTPDCIYEGQNDEFIGVALDGFPIYGVKDANGNDIKTADLDECHGRTENGQYRYRLTRDYPYIMGCFKGTVGPDVEQRKLTESSCKIVESGAGQVSLTSLINIMFLCFISLTRLY